MKTLLKALILGTLTMILSGCDVLTFGGKTNVEIKNDIVYQTITWNSYSNNQEVEDKFYSFVRETLNKYRYNDYKVLFASNYSLDLGERSYVFRIFKTEEDKIRYLRESDDIIRRTTALASISFRNRWDQLERGMNVGEVYEVLPELAHHAAQQEMFVDKSRLKISDLWLDFDFRGILFDFGRGNMDFSNPEPQRSEDWVF